MTLLVFVVPVALVVGPLCLAARPERALEEARARQMMLTDAIRSKLGAVVVPVVSRRRGGLRRVDRGSAGASGAGR